MKRILIVDDTLSFRAPVASALRMEGYQVSCASNGVEALEMAARTKPDLVLLDVAMPQMDGVSCLEKLRENSQLKDVPVIMLTAMADSDIVMKAATKGVAGYLLKSQFSLTGLIELVRKHAGR